MLPAFGLRRRSLRLRRPEADAKAAGSATGYEMDNARQLTPVRQAARHVLNARFSAFFYPFQADFCVSKPPLNIAASPELTANRCIPRRLAGASSETSACMVKAEGRICGYSAVTAARAGLSPALRLEANLDLKSGEVCYIRRNVQPEKSDAVSDHGRGRPDGARTHPHGARDAKDARLRARSSGRARR